MYYIMGGMFGQKFVICSGGPSGFDDSVPFVSAKPSSFMWDLCSSHSHLYRLSPDVRQAVLVREGDGGPAERVVGLTPEQIVAVKKEIRGIGETETALDDAIAGGF